MFYGEHGAELVEEDDRSSLLAHGRDSHKEAFEELAPPPPPWTHLQAQHSSTDVLRECEGRRVLMSELEEMLKSLSKRNLALVKRMLAWDVIERTMRCELVESVNAPRPGLLHQVGKPRTDDRQDIDLLVDSVRRLGPTDDSQCVVELPALSELGARCLTHRLFLPTKPRQSSLSP